MEIRQETRPLILTKNVDALRLIIRTRGHLECLAERRTPIQASELDQPIDAIAEALDILFTPAAPTKRRLSLLTVHRVRRTAIVAVAGAVSALIPLSFLAT